jgi:hypothetical protein
MVYTPTTKQELVWAVRDIEQRALTVRAIGSDMALSHVGYSDDATIKTEALNRHVLQPCGAAGIPAARLRNPGTPLGALASCVAPDVLNRNPLLVFIEGGMKIHELIPDLQLTNPMLALPAMGAGGRQGVVGSLATGTHGAEVDRQPLIDAIRAVHLVGPGGQEWWIERSNGWSVKEQLALVIPDWCPDTIVVNDDTLFYSALVGVGRLGVIYAIVLEVEPEYWLEEWRTPDGEPWAAVKSDLQASIDGGYDTVPTGIFYRRGPLTFLQIALNPNDLTNCWIVGRRHAPDGSPDVGLTKTSFDPIQFFCHPIEMPWVHLVLDQLRPILSGAVAGVAPFIPEPIIASIAEGVAQVEIQNIINDIETIFQQSANLGQAMGAILIRYPYLMVPLTSLVISQNHSNTHKVGQSGNVMDQNDYTPGTQTDCYGGIGAEYHFNARAQGFLTFIDQLFNLAHSLGGIPGYVSLRFIRQTDAFLGMERFPLTVAIEPSCLQPWATGDTFLTGLQGLAIASGGIPHWGQKLYGSIGANNLYKNSFSAFLRAVAKVEAGQAAAFRTAFAIEQGLNPPAPGPTQFSLKGLLTAARSVAPSDPAPTSALAVARLFTPSLRMNPDKVDLPRGRACRFQRGVSLRDLALRLL